MKVFIIGSSHIRRFSLSCKDFGLPQHTIRMEGISGGHVNDLYYLLPDVQEFNPDILLIQIGGMI